MKNKNRYDMKRSEVDSFLDIMLVLYLFQVPCRIFFSSSLSFLPLGCCNQCFNTCLALYSSHPPPQLSMEQYFSLCCAITSEKINRNKHFHHQKKMYFLFRSCRLIVVTFPFLFHNLDFRFLFLHFLRLHLEQFAFAVLARRAQVCFPVLTNHCVKPHGGLRILHLSKKIKNSR